MESQPNELILQQLLNMPYKTMLNTCNSNNSIKNVCDNNEDYIYKKLLERDYMQKINYKFLYKLCEFESKYSNGILNKKNHFKILTNAIDKGLNYLNKVLNYNIIDINIKGKDNTGSEMTPLIYALKWGKPEIIYRLLDFNANIDSDTLRYAIIKQNINILNRILEHNVKIHTIELIVAIQMEDDDIINAILDKIDVKYLNEKYNDVTPLNYAIKKNINIDILDKMKQLGAE